MKRTQQHKNNSNTRNSNAKNFLETPYNALSTYFHLNYGMLDSVVFNQLDSVVLSMLDSVVPSVLDCQSRCWGFKSPTKQKLVRDCCSTCTPFQLSYNECTDHT